MDWGALHWIRPLWLLAIPAVWAALLLIRRNRRAGGDWSKVVDRHLLRWLVSDEAEGRRRHGYWWLPPAMLTLALIALAGPSWQQQPHGSFSARQARVVALDLSRSMLAEDIKPSRLIQARFKLNDLLALIEEGQVGLVAYSGQAFVVSPLSSDTATIANMVPALHSNIMPAQGSRADRAMELAAELIRKAGLQGGEIILITDGLDARAREKASQLNQQGIRVSVLGIGTENGAPIPSGDGFLQDTQGNIVVSRLDAGALRRTAQAGGGRYLQAAPDNSELPLLLLQEAQEFEGNADQLGTLWQDQGPWLVLLLIPLAAFSFRRGWLLLLPWLILPLPGQAAEWADWWQRGDQQAQAALQAGDAAKAAAAAKSPELQAEARYRLGDWTRAVDLWSQLDHADAHYNRGNALAQAGEFEPALEAYQRALSMQPEMADAQANYDLVKQLLEQQQQQNSEGEGDSSSESSQQDSQSSESQGEEQSGEQEQQSQESEQQSQEQQQAEAQEGDTGDSQTQAELSQEDQWSEEDQQAMEQWLRQIPDDPGGLLRRKFRAQHEQRQVDQRQTEEEESESW